MIGQETCPKRLAALLIAICGGLLPWHGCAKSPDEGWTMASTHDDQYRTISVPMFTNSTWFRGLEVELGRSLVVEIESTTPYKVTGQGTADTLLRGRIQSAELIKLSGSVTTGLANEMLFKAVLDFEWIDLATGETIVERQGFAASALFTPSRPSQETIDLARFGVVQQLAADLVDALRDDW
ncbi:MAG: LPS assembly lipoprotein LptE [Phycisphaerales bacterium]